MKRLMAMITIGRDVSSFFPDVVKNVVVESQEVKKLVYMYLIHYAEQNQELALLTINSFQKDLASHSQRVRANAMKAMSSIRIPVAIPLVMLALKTAVKDHSSYVRRAAAAAIPKVWSVDTDQQDLLIELITELLTNNEPLVLGSAIFAFNAVCPERLDLLHPHFRKICHLLADFDEWGQIITLDLLLRYGRTQFLDPITASSKKRSLEDDDDATRDNDMLSPSHGGAATSSSPTQDSSAATNDLDIFNTVSSSDKKDKKSKKDDKKHQKKPKKKSDSFYSDDDDDDHSSSNSSNSDSSRSDEDSSDDDFTSSKKKSSSKRPNPPALPAATKNSAASSDPFSFASRQAAHGVDDKELDEDHRLLLKQASQLLQSSNTGVIVGVASLMWSLAPTSELTKVVRPLVRLSRNKRNIQYVVLNTIATMSSSHPLLFRPYLKDFFVTPSEPRYVKEIKLDILTCITSDTSIGLVMKEFVSYTQDPDKLFVMKSITSLGKLAQALPLIAERTIRGLMNLIHTTSDEQVMAQCIVVIRQLFQSNVANLRPALLQSLAKLLDDPKVSSPQARVALVWMVGEYRDKIAKLAPDLLRKLLKTFMQENELVKIQILNLALKLYLANPKQTANLFKYTMDLCKYDSNIDLRDRARMMRSLFFKKKATTEGAPVKEAGSDVKDHFKSVLLVAKPPPKLILPFEGRDKWILGTLSHTLNQRVQGYKELPDFPAVQPDPNTRKPKTISSVAIDTKKDTKSKSSGRRRHRRGSGSDSGSSRSGSDDSSRSRSRSRSGSDYSRSSSRSSRRSDESEFSSFGSESERSDSSRSRSRGRSRSRSSSRGRSRSRSPSSRRRRSRSSSRSDSSRSRSRSRSSGSDSDNDRRRSRRGGKRSARRSRSVSSSRSRSRSPSSSPKASSSAAGGAPNWSLDFLDLKGLDLSSGALSDPNLSSGGFGALGEANIKFTHPNSGGEDLLSPFAGLPSSGSPPSASSSKSTTATNAARAEDDILTRAFGSK